MVFTNEGRKFVAFAIGSDIANNYISAIGIGSGSGTAVVGNTTLVSEHTRTMITGSPDFTTAQKVTFTGDYASTTMSGLTLTEFGLFASGPVNTGSVWQREGFGSIVFDGTNELQIVSTIEVF